MICFTDKLLEIEAESYWKPEEPGDPQGGFSVLRRQFQDVLNLICRYYPQVSSAYAAITGIKPGEYTPLAAINRDVKKIHPSSLHAPNTLVAKNLMEFEPVHVLSNPHKDPFFKGDPAIRSKAIIKLDGYGELFGFVSLDSLTPNAFDLAFVHEIKKAQKVLSRVLADSVFTMRLWNVALSFGYSLGNGTLSELYKQICDQTILAFAACGVVLRAYDSQTDHMKPVEWSGNVEEMLLEQDSVGERITRLVFKDPDFNWTVGMLEDDKDPFYSGTKISQDIEEELRSIGIQAYCVFRLGSDMGAAADSNALGTLSFFHRHPHRFSWRDIALASSLCKQAGNLIALYKKQEQLEKTTTDLRATTEELEFTNEILKIESGMMTRVEIVTLLAHDLGHKAMAVMNSFERFLNNVKKSIRIGQPFNSIKDVAEETQETIALVVRGLNNVNTLFMSEKGKADERQEFSLADAVQEVMGTMAQAMHRYNMYDDIKIPKNTAICGARPVLSQILFNLLINSIDAQRARRQKRKNTVHVHAETISVGEESRLLIKFWDEGPGIDQSIFNDPQEIFDLGATSKDRGTGRGLTISRNLLNTYYNGDIYVQDPKKAFFHIIMPLKR